MARHAEMPLIRAYEVPLSYLIRQEHFVAPDNRLLGKLFDYADRMREAGIRKERHMIRPGETFPSPFDETLEALQNKFGIRRPKYNTLIFKRYEQGVGSDAFNFHTDPLEFLGREKDFMLYSPMGRATFRIKDKYDKITPFLFVSNSALLIPGDIPIDHDVSPPDPDFGINGERLMAFFGQSDIPFVPLLREAA